MSSPRCNVAIVGMACIYPGAPNVETFWKNIISKVDAVSEPPEGWGADDFFDPESTANDRIYCKKGGFIDKFTEFDPIDFGIMPHSVDGGDPEHFLTLQVAREALGDAGYLNRPFDRKRTALVLGRGSLLNRGNVTALQHGLIVDQTLRILKRLHPETSDADLQAIKQELKANLPPFNADTVPGLIPNLVTGLVANRLDLQGPNYTVDAACASSLIALDVGIRELLGNRCDMAIVGGAQVATPALVFMMFCHLGALSRRGQIRPFDKEADGTLLGEGIGMIVIKRLEDAERDGDHIYAIVKGVGIASDGRAVGVLVPRVEGEELALQRTYEMTAISPDTIGLIEAHGTGTPVGDAVEIQALSRVFGPGEGVPRCALGTVKSMISHTIPAGGIAGVIKAALALDHKILPPTLHCEEPNPNLGLEKTPFYINTETRPWIHGGAKPRRAGVNAFGFGGINAHAILEEYTRGAENDTPRFPQTWDAEVFIIRGESRQSLINKGKQLLQFLSKNPSLEIKDLAYSLNCSSREVGEHRLSIVAGSLDELEKKLTFGLQRLNDPDCKMVKDRSGIFFFEEPLAREGTVGVLFPGEGSQYGNMLSDLCLHFPGVRACFDRADRIFVQGKRRPLLSQLLFPPPLVQPSEDVRFGQGLWEMNVAVDSVFNAEYAIYDLFNRLQIKPQAVVGHSSGEFCALLASGALPIEDESQLIRYSLDLNSIYKSIEEQVPEARLLAVGAANDDTVKAIIDGSRGALTIAMDNCPNQVVLCGSEAAVKRALSSLEKKGAICSYLPFNRAYHTPSFQPICQKFAEFFGTVKIVPPHTVIYSCATAQPYPRDPDEIRKLAVDQWAKPVRFRETIEAMYDAGVRIFIEVGPKDNLTSFVQDILGRRRYLVAPVNVPNRSAISQLNLTIGLLAAHGVPIRMDYLYARRNPRRMPILEANGEPIGQGLGTAEGTKAKSGTIKLNLALPRLTAGERTPSHLSDSRVISQAAPDRPKLDNSEAERIGVTAEGSYLPRRFSKEVLQKGKVTAGDRSRWEVMQEHLQTMEGFLRIQQEILEEYLNRKRTAPAKTRGFGWTTARKQGSAGDSTREGRPGLKRGTGKPPAQPQGPFGIIVDSITPEKELTAHCGFDMNEHIYLRDHTLGRRPSLLDETLLCLPVVPLTVSTELMAQAASLLVPDQKLTAMIDVQAHRWIEVKDGEPYELLITAKQIGPPGRVEIKVEVLAAGAIADSEDPAVTESQFTTPAAPGSNGNCLLIEGRMIFSPDYPDPPQIEDPTAHSGELYGLRSEQIYEEMMFHGPTFRAIGSMDRMGGRGAEATLVVPSDSRLFHSPEDPNLHTDIVLLDAAGQVVGSWAMKRLDSGFMAFPTGFEALHIYRPFPPRLEPVKCYARINLLDDHNIRTDMDLIDSKGLLVAQFKGWKDRRFYDVSRRFYQFELAPCKRFCSVSWPDPISDFPNSLGLRCTLLAETGSGIWPRVLAHSTLNRRERETWFHLPGPERRRREWLLGRVAVKDAVRFYLRDRHQVESCPADIEILNDEYGRPVVGGELIRKLGCRVSISMTHWGKGSAAIAGELGKGEGLGIDVEPLERNHEGLEEIALTHKERELLSAVPGSEKNEWLLRLWCSKEAVGKALGRGMMGDPLNIVIQNIDARTGRVELKMGAELARRYPDYGDTPFIAFTGSDGTLVFAASLV